MCDQPREQVQSFTCFSVVSHIGQKKILVGKLHDLTICVGQLESHEGEKILE